MLGYAMFYFVRKNLPVAMPVMEQQLGISKTSLGLFLTLHGLLYGVSKFANGFIGDRVNARWFMAIGLFCSAMLNIAFGMSATVTMLGVIWMLNGWFQGMGFPPCARLMTHWFSPKELATKMSVWNMSHGLGAAGVFVLCGVLVGRYHDWRVAFFIPAAMAIACCGLLMLYLRDTPESVGLADVPGTCETASGGEEPFASSLAKQVFANPYIWILSIANFFVYTIRYAVLDWAVTMLNQSKGVTLANAGLIVAGFEVAGGVGALGAGWLTDRLCGGRGARTSVLCMVLGAGAGDLVWR